MKTLKEALAEVRGSGSHEYARLRAYVEWACPDAVKALRLINAERMLPARRKGFSLVKVANKKQGFLYYVRYSHGGKMLPSKWNTHTNKLAEAEQYAMKNKERLVKGYLKRHDGALYEFLGRFYGQNSAELAEEAPYRGAVGEKRRMDCEQVIKEKFIPFLKGERIGAIEEVTVQKLAAFQDYLKRRGLRPQSVNNDMSAVKKVFKYLARKGEIAHNPCKEVERMAVKEADGLYPCR